MDERDTQFVQHWLNSLQAFREEIRALAARADSVERPTASMLHSSPEIHKAAAGAAHNASSLAEAPRNIRINRAWLLMAMAALTAVILSEILLYRTISELQKSGDATQIQVRLMQRQFEADTLSMKRDQRAWLVVKFPPPALIEDTYLSVPLTVENIGKTIAERVHGFVSIEILKAGENPDFSYPPGRSHAFGPTGNIPPNVPDTTHWIAADKSPIVLTSALHDQILSGSHVVAIHGRLEYVDIFGSPHWLTFCRETAGANRRAVSDHCAAYNDTDPN